MSSPFTDLNETPIPTSQILGFGRTGLVIRREHIAVKLPIRWDRTTESDFEMNIKTLHREQDIYTRLESIPGVVPCIGCSEKSIELALMEKVIHEGIYLDLGFVFKDHHYQNPSNSHGSAKSLVPWPRSMTDALSWQI